MKQFETFNPRLLDGKTALVTGGGSGLGLAIATRYAQLGATVVLCGRREAALDVATAAINANGAHATAWSVACDIRDPEAIERMMDRIWQVSPLDILVNNAAATFIAQSHLLSPRAVKAILDVTLNGTIFCTLAAGRRWIERGGAGTVLSILSTSTLTGRAFTMPSAAAKSGVLAMTRSLAVEWGKRSIRLVAIAPGAFPTPGSQAGLGIGGAREPAAAKVPLGRTGDRSELADLAAFMVSQAAAYMNGEMVTLDGGLHLRTSGADDLLSWTDDEWKQHRESRV